MAKSNGRKAYITIRFEKDKNGAYKNIAVEGEYSIMDLLMCSVSMFSRMEEKCRAEKNVGTRIVGRNSSICTGVS